MKDFFSQRSGVRRFLLFAAAGGTATAVQYATLIAIVELTQIRPQIASVMAYLCGAVASYLLSAHFVFPDVKTGGRQEVLRFAAVNLTGLVINTIIFSLLVKAGVFYVLAQVAASAIVLVWSFFGARMFVFRR